jgi:2-aminoadipate transaminase
METISFARGIPAPECLPVEELADCAQAALERDGDTVLSYGSSAGYAPLREWIAERHGVDPARVLVTNGSLQGMVFLAERFAGERVLVEAPTYDRPLKILAAHGVETTPIAMDDEGLDLDALAQVLESGDKPAFLYTIPTFQNPSGRTLSTERRHRLAEIAREHELLVLEDDPYGLVRFDGEAPPTLFELEGGTCVAYSSSFSKTIAPGLRVGYFVLPLALERELPDARWSRPQGGYFVWLELPEGADAGALLERATAAGVTFVPGADFGGAPNTARLAFSFVSPDEIREGVRRLAALVREPLAV